MLQAPSVFSSVQVAVEIQQEQNVKVGEYKPLTLIFTPSVNYYGTIAITISGITLNTSGNSCSTFVSLKKTSAGGSFVDIPVNFCSYIKASKSVAIETSYSSEAEISYKIKITINNVLYGTSLTSTEVTISTQYIDLPANCKTDFKDLETYTNSIGLKPDLPATFGDGLYFEPTEGVICSKINLLWSFTPVLSIEMQSDITIDIDKAIDLSQGTCQIINNLHYDLTGQKFIGNTVDPWSKNTILYLPINDVTMPNTELTFKSTITTYTKNGYRTNQKVHEGITAITTISPYIGEQLNSIVVGDVSKLTVGDLNDYKISIAGICGTLTNAQVEIVFPSIFAIAQGETKIKTIASLNTNPQIVSIKLVNPISEKSKIDLAGKYFTYTVSQGGKRSFIIKATLDNTIEFSSGFFSSFAVQITSKKAGAVCDYKFTIGITHLIPVAGQLRLKLDPSITILSESYIEADNIDTDNSNMAGSLALLVFTARIEKGTTYVVTLKGLKNPITVTTYDGFDVLSTDDQGSRIDTRPDGIQASINITEPGDAEVACDIDNDERKVNLAMDFYVCKFTSPYFSIPYPGESATNTLILEVPGDVTGCSQVEPIGSELSLHKYSHTINGGSTNELTFRLRCTNPPTSKPTQNFTLILYNGENRKILSGNDAIQTVLGTNIDARSCSFANGFTFPNYNTKWELTFTKANPNGIRYIVIVSNAIKATTACKATVGSIVSSGCLAVDGSLNATLSLVASANTIKVSNIAVTNPNADNAQDTENKFYITTYDNSGYKVDESYEVYEVADTNCVLPILCNYPCETCETGLPDKCVTCTKDSGVDWHYYLYENMNYCGKLTDNQKCDTGIYIGFVKIGYDCRKCSSSCKTCENTINTCTSCFNNGNGDYLYNAQCVASCTGNTYPVDGEIKRCEVCNRECSTCLSATVCTACNTGRYLNDDSCVIDCPQGKYEDVNICKNCQRKCKTCDNASTCSSCEGILYLLNNDCVAADFCTSDFKRVTTDDNKCIACISPCLTCKILPSSCYSCENYKVLFDKTCQDRCPEGYYNSSFVCEMCEEPCKNCDAYDSCLTCVPNFFYIPADKKCFERCPDGKFASDKICSDCDSKCKICEGIARNCTDCESPLLLSNNQCIPECLPGTYEDSGACKPCSDNCYKCESLPDKCTSCKSAKPYLQGSTCVQNCSSSMTPIFGVCQNCDPLCETCSGFTDFCVTCRGTNYAYNGHCYSPCPIKTTQAISEKICVPCEAGCDECTWSANNANYPDTCIKCTSGYKYFNYKCYSNCPTGYVASADGTSCIGINDPNNKNSSESTKKSFLPFPHLIVAGILGIVVIAGQSRDGRALICSNLIITFNYVAIFSYVFQVIWAARDSEGLIVGVTVVAIIIQILLNICFLFFYRKSIAFDPGFTKWGEAHGCIKYTILTLSTIFSLQTCRLFYSRLLGFGLFFVKFADYDKIFTPLNCFSLIQTIFVHCVIVVLNFFLLFKLNWVSTLYITIIESFILSVFLLILLAYEMKSTISIKTEFEQDNSKYSQLGDISMNTTKMPDEDKLRKEIYDSVFQKLNIASLGAGDMNNTSLQLSDYFSTTKRKPKRRHSFDSETTYQKEKDMRSTGSYPCSPKTTRRKEVPLAKYGFVDNSTLAPEKLPDNVYSEAIVKDPSKPIKPMDEFGVQTPPFDKVEIFKRHMKRQGYRERKIFEQSLNSLEMIPENLNENENEEKKAKCTEIKKADIIDQTIIEESKKLKKKDDSFYSSETGSKKLVMFPIIFPKNGVSSSVAEEEVSKHKSKFNRPESPPQAIEELTIRDISKPLNPIDETKVVRQVNKSNPAAKADTVIEFNEVQEQSDKIVYMPMNLSPESKKAGTKEVKKKESNKNLSKQTKEVRRSIPKKDEKKPKETKREMEAKNELKSNILDFNIEEKQIVINDSDIMGNFDKDAKDGCILIRENREGNLIDLDGRHVNKYGYLIDVHGDIINKNGEFVMSKEEFDKELGEDTEYPKHTIPNNELFNEQAQRPLGEVTPVEDIKKVEKSNKAVNENISTNVAAKDKASKQNNKEDISEARKSVSLDSMMEDTPSNYNIQNQRFNNVAANAQPKRVIEKRSQYATEKTLEYENPTKADIELAKIYGGKPRGAPKKDRNTKSVYKREFEKIFQEVDMRRQNSSDLKDLVEETKGNNSENKLHSKEQKNEIDEENPKNIHNKYTKSNAVFDDTKLDQAYSKNLEDMFLASDPDDKASVGSIVPSVMSRVSNKSERLRGLESIYLQRLENSAKFRKKGHKANKRTLKQNVNKESESERDEIASLLSDNYKEMQKQFQKITNAEDNAGHLSKTEVICLKK